MKKRLNNWKKLRGVMIVVALTAVVGIGQIFNFSASAASQNYTISGSTTKIFVGSYANVESNALHKAGDNRGTAENSTENKYVNERKAFLKELSGTNAEEVFSAVVLFSDYYSVEEVSRVAKENSVVVDRVYLWMPGETGRLSISVKNGDIQKSLNEHFKRYLETGIDDEQMASDYRRLMSGEFGVFSIVVTSNAKTLFHLSEAKEVSLVDVKYNKEVEAYANQQGYKVQYIELPSKPDGAL